MAKVLPIATKFMAGHPRAGEPTYFVEQILNALNINYSGSAYIELLFALNPDTPRHILTDFQLSLAETGDKKLHTIRAGNRWKPGDMFSPRVWGTDVNPKSGRKGPYHSKQIIIAPDQKVEKTWGIEIAQSPIEIIVPKSFYKVYDVMLPLGEVAKNDGLSIQDFSEWFKKSFTGQIICWDKNLSY